MFVDEGLDFQIPNSTISLPIYKYYIRIQFLTTNSIGYTKGNLVEFGENNVFREKKQELREISSFSLFKTLEHLSNLLNTFAWPLEVDLT